MRIGHGYDVHRFKEGRKLILGGVHIEGEIGLDGHSDADVVIHSVADSILGALALGDIGRHFPDSSDKFKDIDSRILLRRVGELMDEAGYFVGNIDVTIIAQSPKLSPFIPKMRENIKSDLKSSLERVSIKATTEEHLGFTGRKEGISCHCVCLLEEKNN